MSEDFYIKFSSASRWEGRVHYLMVEPRERVEVLMPLLRQLVQSAINPGELHICPVCQKEMKVSFLRFSHSPELDISTYCKTCNIIVLFDTNQIPPWAPKPITLSEALEMLGKREPGDEV